MSELKSVSLVGFAIPTSNKKGGNPITMDDLKVVKAKEVKAPKEVKPEQPHFDFYWNSARSMFNMKKSIIATNKSDDEGFTFFYTENKELLLIQSTKANPVPHLRPKFLKGPRAANTFTSEFGEFAVRMMFEDLNKEVTDGEYYNLSENQYFTFEAVDAGDSFSKVFLVTNNAWKAKQPVVEAPVAESGEVEAGATEAANVQESPEPSSAIEPNVSADADDFTANDFVAEAVQPSTGLGLDFASIGTDAPQA